MRTSSGSGDDWVSQRVIRFLAEYSGRDPADISPSDLLDEFAIDSLDMVEFIMSFEEAFDLEISDEHFAEMRTVQDLIDAVRRWLS